MTVPVQTQAVNDVDVALRARTVAQEVAARHAGDVDKLARLPTEALEALRSAGLLGALIPVEQGGLGASLADVAQATTELGRTCSSTAMIFAMHQIQVACLVAHGDTPQLSELLRRTAADHLLLASATTEMGIGGDVRRSSCAVELDGAKGSLVKQAPVISYGTAADAILTTARRNLQSAAGDQVLVACLRESTRLEPVGTWDALGFRGTASLGYLLTSEFEAGCVFPASYADISSATMLPVSHILWSAVWLGIAEAAAWKARKFVQDAARKNPGVSPPGALRVAELEVVLGRLRDTRDAALMRYDRDSDLSMGSAAAMNAVKISASELVVEVVHKALQICGMAGYREDSLLSLGRLLRDAHGAALMVSNDRILANNAQLLLVHRGV